MTTCVYCGSDQIIKRHIRDAFWHNGQLTIIEDVPVDICRRCGQRYYDAAVLDEMERIAEAKDGVLRTMLVPVKTFPSITTATADHDRLAEMAVAS